MIVGEDQRAQISARRFWNRTGIVVEPSATHRLTAEGRWWDWLIACDAGGYALAMLRWAEAKRRVPDARWFALCGAIEGPTERRFVIGRHAARWRPPEAGELMCFANDLPSMYFNNWGCVDLSVIRTSQPARTARRR